MPHYLLAIQQPDGPPPDEEFLAPVMADLARVNDDLRAAGSWVFTGGLHGPESATVLRPGGVLTDGPYVEAKEHVGGIYVVDVEDLDAALRWGRRVSDATGLPVEVRPFR